LRYLRPRSRRALALSPRSLSRLGQYRKRLTCTLTCIHMEPCVRRLSTSALLAAPLRPETGHWPMTHTSSVYRYWNRARHKTALNRHCTACVIYLRIYPF
jgi:hypothetical protein